MIAVLLVGTPLVLAAQGGPLRPMSVVQLEGGVARQAPAAGQTQAPRPAQTPLPTVPVTQLDQRQLHPDLDVEPFSFDFADPQPIRNILSFLLDGTNLSFIVDPAVDATWEGDVKEKTRREALDLIMESTGLDYSIRNNVVRVFPLELETRFFPIDYVITQRGGTRGMSASSGGTGGGSGGGSGGASGGGTGGGGSASSGGGASGGSGGSGGSSSSVGGTDAPQFFEDLESGVRAMLSSSGGMNMDRTAGLLFVRESPARLDRIGQYIDTVMLRVTRQVRLEARVIEVALNETFSAGINWNALIGSLTKGITVGQTLLNPGGGFTISGNVNDNFSAILTAFNQQGNATVLSSPSAVTMNNQPTIMSAGTQEIIFNTTTQRDSQGVITQSASIAQPITVGVVLSVTPQISADGTIMLSLNPSVTEHTGDATSRLGDVAPILSQRTTDTMVRVKDGETIVIAGLMQDKINTANSSVPVLGSLPFIGGAFRSTTKTKTKTDLVIMITVTLMNPTQVVDHTANELRRVDAAQRANEKRR